MKQRGGTTRRFLRNEIFRLSLAFVFGTGLGGLLTHYLEEKRFAHSEEYRQRLEIFQTITDGLYQSDKMIIDLFKIWTVDSIEQLTTEEVRTSTSMLDSLITLALRIDRMAPRVAAYFDLEIDVVAGKTIHILNELIDASFIRIQSRLDQKKIESLYGIFGIPKSGGIHREDFKSKHDEFTAAMMLLQMKMLSRIRESI